MFQKHKLNRILKGQYMTTVFGIQNNLIVPMTHLHESISSKQLTLKTSHSIQNTQVSAPSSPMVDCLCMHVRTVQDGDMNNADTTGTVIENDTRTPLITSNMCMLNNDTNSHNPSLIYPSITTHHCEYPNLT